MKNFWSDFKKFISRGNVVDMAVGVAVASAFTAIVTAFTKGFISPLLALLSGESTLGEMKTVIRAAVTETAADGTVTIVTPEVAILWGAFLQAIIDFLIIALALFVMLRVAMSVSNSAKKISDDIKKLPATQRELAEQQLAEKAEAEAKAAAEKAEAEAKAAAEKAEAEAKAAAEKEEAEARARAAVTDVTAMGERQEALLTEIRDLLKSLNKQD